MKRVYIAGPYMGADYNEIDQHIRDAEEAAIWLANNGIGFFCAHTHTAHFEVKAKAGEAFYRELDMTFLAECDAMLMLPDWESSRGANAEMYEFEVRFPDRSVFYWEHEYERDEVTAALLSWAAIEDKESRSE